MEAMTWHKRLGASLLVACLLIYNTAFAQTRHGEILEVRAIENKGSDISEKNSRWRDMSKLPGQMMGALATTKIGGKLKSGTGVTVGMLAGEYVADRVTDKIVGVGPSKRYMLKIGFDDKSKIAVAKSSTEVEGLGQGSRVVVTGSGDDMTIKAE